MARRRRNFFSLTKLRKYFSQKVPAPPSSGLPPFFEIPPSSWKICLPPLIGVFGKSASPPLYKGGGEETMRGGGRYLEKAILLKSQYRPG